MCQQRNSTQFAPVHPEHHRVVHRDALRARLKKSKSRPCHYPVSLHLQKLTKATSISAVARPTIANVLMEEVLSLPISTELDTTSSTASTPMVE